MDPCVKRALRPYESSAMPNLPGTGNILTLPMDIAGCIKSIHGALRIQDKESFRDAVVRSAGLPFNALNSLGQNAELGISLGLLPTDRFSSLAKVTGILGIIFCLIEGMIESFHIFRQKRFLHKLGERTTLLDKIAYIEHKYISPQKKEKRIARNVRLARLVRPWAAEKMIKEVPRIRQLLRSRKWHSNYLGNLRGESLLKIIEEQSEKKLLLHYLGIATLIVTLLGLILTLPHVTIILPSVFLSLGTVMGIARYILHKGYYDSEGWVFNTANVLPKWLAKRLYPINPDALS